MDEMQLNVIDRAEQLLAQGIDPIDIVEQFSGEDRGQYINFMRAKQAKGEDISEANLRIVIACIRKIKQKQIEKAPRTATQKAAATKSLDELMATIG